MNKSRSDLAHIVPSVSDSTAFLSRLSGASVPFFRRDLFCLIKLELYHFFPLSTFSCVWHLFLFISCSSVEMNQHINLACGVCSVLCMFLGLNTRYWMTNQVAHPWIMLINSPSLLLLISCISSSRGGTPWDFPIYVGCQLLLGLFRSCLGSHVVEISWV